MDDTTSTLVAFASGHALRDRAAIVSTLVDTVGVTFAGQDSAPVQAVRSWLEPATGAAVVWSTTQRRAPSSAALVNGTAAHALDFDDAGLTMPIHPSAVLWPAVLAIAPAGTGVGRVLAAVEAGHVMIRAIADVLPMNVHYARGWHATSTIGRIAATLACARVVDLDEERTAHALGIAASTASGSLANFGTGTKPLHVGLAARDAVTAVGLAAAGMTANTHELDAPNGFLARYGDPAAAADVDLRDRLEHWSAHWVADTVPKRFPSCFGTHRAVTAAVDLHRAGVSAEDVEKVLVEAHPSTLEPLLDHEPSTGGAAKFSMAFTVARALQTGGLGLADFADDGLLADPVIRRLSDATTVVGLDAPTAGAPRLAGQRFARVAVTTADGTEHARVVTLEDPADLAPYSVVAEKFVRTVSATGRGTARAEALLSDLETAVDEQTVDRLNDVLSGKDTR
jgi:2-methylcitrate dehydratase PrpD